jgi:hypothetical protein
MKIHKLSHVIAAPFALLLFYILYQTFFNKDDSLLIYGLIPTIILVLLYLFQPQINYWWLSKHPIKLEDKVLKMLNKTNHMYRNMNSEQKIEFENRLSLYAEGNAFMSKGMDQDFDVPYDVKLMTAQIPVTMMWNNKDRFLKAFERIVIYKHPFPSPKFKFLHTAETDIEDGVIIFSLEHAEAAFLQPEQFYNVAWYAYAEAFVKAYPNEDYPEIDDDTWSIIEKVQGLTQEKIMNTLGYESVDILPILISSYFYDAKKLASLNPTLHKSLQDIFS